MEVVYRRCCGIDVHQDFLTACVLVNEPGKPREVRKKEFRTYWSDLQKLKLWLYASKVERVAMESTGVYSALSSALIGRVQVPLALG